MSHIKSSSIVLEDGLVVWRMTPSEAFATAEFLGDQLPARDGFQRDVAVLYDTATKGLQAEARGRA